MYRYNDTDRQILRDRVNQFRNQTSRYLAGQLSESEFLPLRLQNGLYKQRLAPMMRISIPYGLLSSKQLRALAQISRDYDRGYVHFTTRQNVQLNWPHLEEVPDILQDLAKVEMHAIQTSGNCIRNITADQFSGVAVDEIEDARPWCEIVRQWASFHPEFAYLPRKFKIAICGSQSDRTAVYLHDIGLELVKNDAGETGFKVLVGGGLGRMPMIAEVIRDFLPKIHLITYLEAILRIYNQFGRRDNKHKARIKVLVKAMGREAFAQRVEEEWAWLKNGPNTLTDEAIARAKIFFTVPEYAAIDRLAADQQLAALRASNKAFSNWLNRNVQEHRVPGYAVVTLSLKRTGIATGNVTDRQLEAIADLADEYCFGEIRTTHTQNLVLADIRKSDLFTVWQKLEQLSFATPNIGNLTDIICCPGGDFCALANAKSIPIAEAIQRRFDDLDYLYDLGDIDLNISGCMNACGHHHVGHIGILGVDKKGKEFYQICLGGDSGTNVALGHILGPSFAGEEVPEVIEKLMATYVERRTEEEAFIDTYRRIGIDPFKEKVYAKNH